MSWRDAPGMSASASGSGEDAPRWAAPLTFTLTAPPELTGEDTSMLDARVTRAQAISVPAVKRARDLIAGTLGVLPVGVRNRRRETVTTGSAHALLSQPEPDVARTVTMTRTFEDMLFEGVSWWRITGFGWDGYPTKVRRLDPRSVNVRTNGRVYVSSTTGIAQGHAEEYVPDAELIRIDSPNDPLLVAGARAIRTALLLDKTAARYADEPLPLGYFAPRDGHEDPMNEEEVVALLDEWEAARRERAWGYVGAALEPHPLQWNPEQLQLAKQRDHAVLEISRIAGVDPEDLGVSTTSRTYANAEQRRLDLLDFTLAAYVGAFESRMSMNDVTPDGYTVRFEYAGFLRSDTKTRMETYKIGREVGVYDDERIAEIEGIPVARPQPTVTPASQATEQQETTTVQQSTPAPVRFADSGEPAATVAFMTEQTAAAFKVDAERRTISGLAVPWGMKAYSGWSYWKFAPDSLHWSDPSRVKMLRDHDHGQPVGVATRLESTDEGLFATFKIARGPEGDRVLDLAADGVLDGLSVGIDFTDGDDWQTDPTDESTRLVRRATLREVSITAMPAFDGARVATVTASRKGTDMGNTAEPQAPANPAERDGSAAQTVTAPDMATFTAGLADAVKAAVSEAFDRLPSPQGREVIPAGRAYVQREAPVYTMNGHGPSMVRDAWKARTEGDHDARERLERFSRQTRDAARDAMFAANTTDHAAVVPPGYRPDLYVTQLMQGRPLLNSISRGTLQDATPFTIPKFVSATGMTGDHTEGVNPTAGTMTVGQVTVTPGAVSGLFELTREIVDASNPAIDMIAMQAMQESYAQQTEQKVWALLNGTDGQGGTITDGFVPSGAQVRVVSGGDGNGGAGTADGADLVAGIREQLAVYPFRRFAAPNRAHLSQSATSALATATGSDGRPLLPSVGATNTAGVGNAASQGWYIDGLAFTPTWSMDGSAATSADVLMFNSNDVWAWESSLLTFRFEERGGPARIDLALFGYFACQVLRPVGLSAIRYDTTEVSAGA